MSGPSSAAAPYSDVMRSQGARDEQTILIARAVFIAALVVALTVLAIVGVDRML